MSSHNNFALYGQFKFQTYFPQNIVTFVYFFHKKTFCTLCTRFVFGVLISNFAPTKALIFVYYLQFYIHLGPESPLDER